MKRWSTKQLLPFLAVILAAFLCSRYLFQLALIQGESMAPAYRNFQIVILDKMTREYEPGDVAAFRCDGLKAVLIKRVAACPGDTAVITDGTLYVNGEKSTVYPEDGYFGTPGLLEEPVLLGEGEYLMLGDNAAQSKDSRYEAVGPVDRDQFLGRVIGGKK